MLKDELLRMDIQMFAEDEDETKEEGTESTDENSTDESEGKEETLPKSKVDGIVEREKSKAYKEAEKKLEAEFEKKLQEKIDEAEKLKKMNATEKAEHEKSKLEKELEEYKRKEALNEMSKEATNMLKEKNIQATDEILSFVVTPEAEATSENVQKFVSVVEGIREELKEEFNRKLGGRTPVGGNKETESSIGAKMAKKSSQKKKEHSVAERYWGTN